MRRRPTSLRLIRIATGISLTEISESTGIGLPRLSRIERAMVQPTEDEVRRILAAMGPEGAALIGSANRFRDEILSLNAEDGR